MTQQPSRAAQVGRRFGIPATAAAAIIAAATISAPLTKVSEGKRNVVYVDRIGRGMPATVCWGHTGPELKVGQRYSDAQCEMILEEDQIEHAVGAYRCTPRIAENLNAFAAVIDFTINLGVQRYCNSTAARRFRVGDFAGGCAALGPSFEIREPNGRTRIVRGYTMSAGQVRRGLVIRRDRNNSLCRTGRWQ
jgi:lysozyme